jgi:hypothetical protein
LALSVEADCRCRSGREIDAGAVRPPPRRVRSGLGLRALAGHPIGVVGVPRTDIDYLTRDGFAVCRHDGIGAWPAEPERQRDAGTIGPTGSNVGVRTSARATCSSLRTIYQGTKSSCLDFRVVLSQPAACLG